MTRVIEVIDQPRRSRSRARFFEEATTAIFASNDISALGVMAA